MRIIVLGGTKFIGRAITEHLVRDGHRVMVVHRGVSEPDDLPEVEHLHCERSDLPGERDRVRAFAPEAAVEVQAMNGIEAAAGLAVLPADVPTVAISSGDVYRAYEGVHRDRQTDPLPLPETAPLRTVRFMDGPAYENLEVESAYGARGATILRLGMVYGPHDQQRRFEPFLRRVRAGRSAIPIGTGSFLFSRVFAGDVARAVALALRTRAARGETFNVVEPRTGGFRLLAEQVVRSAGASDVRLVGVPDSLLPPDLAITGAIRQDMFMDATKVRTVLGWEPTDPERAIDATVAWDMAHPPEAADEDFSADDRALAAAQEPPEAAS